MSEPGFIHIAMSEFTAQEHAEGCSKPEPEMGFGMAGGGYGAYSYCSECGAILDKTIDHDGDDPGESQEWADFDRDC